MSTLTRASITPTENAGGKLMRGALWCGWHVVRLPLLSLLVILEPIVRIVLSALALVGVLVAFLFKFSGTAPHFPFWQMIAISIGCVLTLTVYYGIIRLLSR